MLVISSSLSLLVLELHVLSGKVVIGGSSAWCFVDGLASCNLAPVGAVIGVFVIITNGFLSPKIAFYGLLLDMVDVVVALVFCLCCHCHPLCHHLLEFVMSMRGLGMLLICQFVNVWQIASSCLPMLSLNHVVDVVIIVFLFFCIYLQSLSLLVLVYLLFFSAGPQLYHYSHLQWFHLCLDYC